MEPSQSNKVIDTLDQVKVGLAHYYENRSKLDIWNKIFWILSVYIGKDGTLCLEGQKIINYYLQNKSELSQLGSLVNQNKQIICKIIQICLSVCESIDEAISTGALSQALSKKIIKSTDQNSRSVFKLVNCCAQAVAIHFCQFLRKFRDGNGSNIILTNRRRSKIIKRKYINVTSSLQLCKQIFCQPVVLLQGFLDLLKPMISNHLNIESLFQVTNTIFKSKKAFISYIVESPNSKPQFNGKILKLNSIFDSTHAGREMIQTRLKNLSAQTEVDIANQFWSIVTCLSQQQLIMFHICEHLPQFLRPKSNGDMLSYCRVQYFPTFKYMVSKSGYTSKPILSQFVTVFMNVGKKSVEIICFTNKSGVSLRVRKQQVILRGKNMENWLDSCGIEYTKVRVLPRNIAVVSSNTFYVIVSEMEQKDTGVSQLIYWSVLPKFHDTIKATIYAVEQKKKNYKNYWWLPLQQIFLDYLNHQYKQCPQIQILSLLKSHLQGKLEVQQQILLSFTKKYPQITVSHAPFIQNSSSSSSPSNLNLNLNRSTILCSACHQFFINYYCRNNRRQNLCMACAAYSCGFDNSIQEFVVLHRPIDIRYPITLVSLYLSKRKCPGQIIENNYQKNICPGKFIGATETENCKIESQNIQANKTNKNKEYLQRNELYLQNFQKQLGVASSSEILMSLAVQQPKTQTEAEVIVQKMKALARQIEDPEQLLKQIMPKFRLNNLITDLMWIFKTEQVSLQHI